MTDFTQIYENAREQAAREAEITNVMAQPKIEKIVINLGTADAAEDKQALEKVLQELSQISGQKPQVRLSKKAISGFGIRKGVPVGFKVTLRGSRALVFFEKLTRIVLPRIRDFRGVSRNSFDGRGNYTLGLKETTVFPEIDLSKVGKIGRGLEVTIVTNTGDRDKSFKFLELLGMPFEKKPEAPSSKSKTNSKF